MQDMTVSQILLRKPAAAQAFIDMRTQCVGCPMAKFCTPAEVAAYYGLDRAEFLRLLETERVTGNNV